jgi:hypothetical protein
MQENFEKMEYEDSTTTKLSDILSKSVVGSIHARRASEARGEATWPSEPPERVGGLPERKGAPGRA